MTGPRLRIVRRLTSMLPGLTRKTSERRPQPPGRAPVGRRRRISEYAIRLNEKQKLRFHYGLTEVQLRNVMRRAFQKTGNSGDNLARLLELRLDNVVFRLGFAPTIPAARQLVRHGHILVNGRKTSFPAFMVSKGDQVEVKLSSRSHPSVLEGTQRGPQLLLPDYLVRAKEGWSGRCSGTPTLNDIPIEFEERLVTEFYAAR